MHDLKLVGFTTDRRGLIFRIAGGARGDSYVVPLTDELLAVVAELTAEGRGATGDAVDLRDEGTGAAPVADVRAEVTARPRSMLSVRDIQARLRAGESAVQVASEAGVDEEWIERFAPPVRAEQRRVVEQALECHLERPRAGRSAVPLRRAVGMAMADKGIAFTIPAFERAWSSQLIGHDRWAVTFTYRHRGRDHTATWVYDADVGELTTSDRTASQIGYVPASAKVREDAGVAVEGIIGDPGAATQIGVAEPARRPRRRRAATTAADGANTPAGTRRPPAREAASDGAGTNASATKKAVTKKAVTKKAATKKGAATGRASATKKAVTKKAVTKKAATKRGAATGRASATKKAVTKRAATKRGAATGRASATKKAVTKKAATKSRAVTERASATKKGAATGRASAGKAATGKPVKKAVPERADRAAAADPVAGPRQPPAGRAAPPAMAPVPSRATPMLRPPPPVPSPLAAEPVPVPAPIGDDEGPHVRSRRASDRPAPTPPPVPDRRGVAHRPGEVDLAEVPLAPAPARAPQEARGNGRPPGHERVPDVPDGETAADDRVQARRARAAERNAPTVQFRSGSAMPVRRADGNSAGLVPSRRRPLRGR